MGRDRCGGTAPDEHDAVHGHGHDHHVTLFHAHRVAHLVFISGTGESHVIRLVLIGYTVIRGYCGTLYKVRQAVYSDLQAVKSDFLGL